MNIYVSVNWTDVVGDLQRNVGLEDVLLEWPLDSHFTDRIVRIVEARKRRHEVSEKNKLVSEDKDMFSRFS